MFRRRSSSSSFDGDDDQYTEKIGSIDQFPPPVWSAERAARSFIRHLIDNVGQFQQLYHSYRGYLKRSATLPSFNAVRPHLRLLVGHQQQQRVSTPVKKKKYTTTIENPVLSPNDSIFNNLTLSPINSDELHRMEKPIDNVSNFTEKSKDPTKSRIVAKLSTASTGEKKSAPLSSTPAKKRMKYSTTAIEKSKLLRDDSIICLGDSFEKSKRMEKPIVEASSFTAIKATVRKDAETKDPAIKITTSKYFDPINGTKSKIDSKSSTGDKKSALSSSTPVKKKKKYTTTIENPVLSPNDSIFNDSFDELKRPEKPIGEVVVRKKDERCKLQGHECPCCKDYYDSLGLSPKSRARRVNQISRHRKTYRPYKRVKTPEHFWDLEIPDTQECIRRGYLKRNF